MSAALVGEPLPIMRGLAPALVVVAYPFCTVLTLDRRFACRRRTLDTMAPAVIADPAVVGVMVNNLAVIDVGNARDVDVVDLAVVVEAVALPVAARVACADVAEAVIDATVVADLAAPVSGVPAIHIAGVAPVARRP